MQAFLDAGCQKTKDTGLLDCAHAHIDGIEACRQPVHVAPLTFDPPTAVVECFLSNMRGGEEGSIGSIRIGGCMMPVVVDLIAATEKGFVTMKSRADFATLFGPVDSDKRALAFAVAFTGFDVQLTPMTPPAGVIVSVPGPQSTRVTSERDGYHVRLFAQPMCGCSHPLQSIDLVVTRSGTISELERTTLWEDPKMQGLCVD